MQLDGLEAKFRILSALPFDRRVGRRHTAVLAFIMDWHHRRYGDALASTRFIVSQLKERDPFGKGFYTGDVHAALTDLVSWGYLAQQKGSGRRASRYVPNWSFFDSVRKTPNTTEIEISVLASSNTSVRKTSNATADRVRELPNEDPSTVTRLQDRVTGIDGHECAAPSAPLPAGLPPAVAESAQEGFEQLWQTYAYRKDKKSARLAYAKLDPAPVLQEILLTAATAWRDAWAAQGKADAPRRHLHRWLEDECFDEVPPTAFKPREVKTRSASTSRILDVDATISDTTMRTTGALSELVIQMTGPDGAEIEDVMVLQSNNLEDQAEGQRKFASLCSALGIAGAGDSSEFHGLKVKISRTTDGLRYSEA